jgi:hypothetical protein
VENRGDIISLNSQTQLPVPTKFVVVVGHAVGRTVATKKAMVSHFAGCPVQEPTG